MGQIAEEIGRKDITRSDTPRGDDGMTACRDQDKGRREKEGAGDPRRRLHRLFEGEVFHLLSGRIRFSVDGKPVILTTGDILMAPKGVPHSYIVESQEGAQWITVTTSGDFEALVRETARPATATGLPEPAQPTPEMIAALDAACARNRIRLVGAPLAI